MQTFSSHCRDTPSKHQLFRRRSRHCSQLIRTPHRCGRVALVTEVFPNRMEPTVGRVVRRGTWMQRRSYGSKILKFELYTRASG